MNPKEHDKIAAFDTLYTTNHIQMLKIVMPYVDPHSQKTLAVLIKYMELQYAISCSQAPESPLRGCSMEKEEPDFEKLINELLPYCNASEKTKLEQIGNVFQSMNMYRTMMQTVETMKALFPEGSDISSGLGEMLGGMGDFDPSALSSLFGSLDPNLFSGFGTTQAAGPTSGAPTSGTGHDASDGVRSGTSEESPQPNTDSSPGGGMMDMLMGMLTPEQKKMYEQFTGK